MYVSEMKALHSEYSTLQSAFMKGTPVIYSSATVCIKLITFMYKVNFGMMEVRIISDRITKFTVKSFTVNYG